MPYYIRIEKSIVIQVKNIEFYERFLFKKEQMKRTMFLKHNKMTFCLSVCLAALLEDKDILRAKDILQVDATIITGILILLTLSNVGGVVRAAQGLATIIATTIPFFTISATLILLSGVRPSADKTFTYSRTGKATIFFTIFGFGALAGIILFFYYTSFFAPSLFEKLDIVSHNVTHPAKLAK